MKNAQSASHPSEFSILGLASLMLKALGLLLFSFGVQAALFSDMAKAETMASIRNARTSELQHSSLIVKSLGHSCLALRALPDSLPCNPGYISHIKKSGLKLEGLFSNGYSNLSRTQKILNNEFDEELMSEFFQNQNVLQAETFFDLMFVSPIVGSRFSPFSYKLFVVIRNSANPEIDLYAVEEKDLLVQIGKSWGNFTFGLEMKSTEWKFVRQRFKLLSLATQEGMNAIRPKTQKTVFFNPSLSYEFNTYWSPRIVLQGNNYLGSITEEYAEFPHPQELNVGLGLSPGLVYGSLDFLLDYKSLSFEEAPEEKIHFGALYRLGAIGIGAGLDSNGVSLGLFQGLDSINAGILFTSTRQPWRSIDYYAETVYVQIGWQI